MWRKTLSILLSLSLALPGFMHPHPATAQEVKKNTLAVLNLVAQGISESEAAFLTEALHTQVSRVAASETFRNRTGRNYTVLERSQMDKIFDQFDIQNTGCTDVSCAVEFGKMLSAERIVIGSVGLVGNTYSILIRMVDVESSGTLDVADYTYTGEIDQLLTAGIPSVVDELMYPRKKGGRKLYYIAGAVIVAAGAAAAILSSSSKDDGGGESGTIHISLPVPDD